MRPSDELHRERHQVAVEVPRHDRGGLPGQAPDLVVGNPLRHQQQRRHRTPVLVCADARRTRRIAWRDNDVDIVEETDVEALFEAYTAMMDDLSASYPTVTFLHVTVTPTRWQPENNAKIEEFNELVRQEYADRGRLVDLAGALSRCPDGTVDRHETEEGDSYSQICEAFTRDGGHLSPEGAATAAAELLSVVAANLVDR